MKLIKDIIQGAKDLPGFGPHPGTGIMIALVIAGGLAGLERGLGGFLFGAAFMSLWIVPMWMAGCVGRARDYQRKQKSHT